MGTFQATAFDARPAAGSHGLAVKTRRQKSKTMNRRATISPPNGPNASGDLRTERAVVELAIAGDAAAQQRVFADQSDRLYRTAYGVLRNREDAEDALQDGLLSAYIRLSSFQGRSSLSTWLTRIVINSALMVRRGNRAHPEESLDEILEGQPKRLPFGTIDPRPSPEEICAAIEMERLIQAQVRELPSYLQTALRVRHAKHCTVAQSSRALGIPLTAFKSRVFRARRRVASGLRRSLLPRSGRLAI